jgi:hypothetical protein
MEEIVQPKVYVRTCVALLALLTLTWGIAYVDGTAQSSTQ